MGLSSGGPLRQGHWDAISPAVRDRLLQRAGNIIEWWADEDQSAPDRRPFAVVFGDRGLFIAEPRVNTEHRPVYALSSYEVDPASFRRMTVDHRPPPHAAAAAAATDDAGPASPDLGMSATARGVLGNLPPKAQELLQAPFLAGERVLRYDWYYEGHEHHLKMFIFYLAGSKTVTVANGTRIIPAGHTADTAHWNLECRRATVTRRTGK
ncbi:hypothetical protein [Actinomadura rudentiformis]|uniref:Uncharacterized protein n=1 Tax=Actinomadura rudentiformis TaxID=359158 RepID=A0A6H9YEM1_9ACTN|nr:hypothetical protein [Actinomadura rudentiformis]KAB2339787.1 hypothetical protein F8566_46810 [Actinomadura rudentiformis]